MFVFISTPVRFGLGSGNVLLVERIELAAREAETG